MLMPATQVPTAEPILDRKNTRKTRATRFFHQPDSLLRSSRSDSKSAILGLRNQASTAPVTMPAPIVGFSDVSGAASSAVIIVSGWARAQAAPTADRPPLIATQVRTRAQPSSGLRQNPTPNPDTTATRISHGMAFHIREGGGTSLSDVTRVIGSASDASALAVPSR